jgi:hypothetical protein
MEKNIVCVLECTNIDSGHLCQQWKKNGLCLGGENRVSVISLETN